VDATYRHDSPIHGDSYNVRLSPRSKSVNIFILVEVVRDSGGYLCISIPTIKHSNLSSYEKIATCKLCSYGDPKYSCHQLQCHRVFMHLEVVERMNWIREVVNTIIFRRIHCNLGTIVNSFPLFCGFSQFEFSRKNLLSQPVLKFSVITQ